MAVITDKNKIEELLTRGVSQVYPSYDEVFELFEQGKPLRIYLGVDPTGKELHLGHTVQLLYLKKILDMGHIPILLIGDFTARIGDPTDKSDLARRQLTKQEVENNMKNYVRQANKVIDMSKVELRYSSEWYEKMSAQEFIQLAYLTTVSQLLERDMFQNRMEAGKAIHTPELFYPFMQGYDSVVLNADGEFGGTDQTFNMLMGRTLVHDMQNREKFVIARKLLEDPATGKKLMSKTAGDYIPIEADPSAMYGGIMSLSDEAIVPLFESITDVPIDKVYEISNRLKQGENPKILKQELAFEIVRMYHGDSQAIKTEQEFNLVFSQGKTPDEVPELSIPDNGISILDALINSKQVSSKTEAKRLISEGAVSIEGKKIEKWDEIVNKGVIIKIGAHRFLKLV